ncbi:RNA polymerase I associated factor, A49-like protein [Delitschia confertaspora ATCC 74209]|uniref:RNA polymerase I associated factor, A49-like protein n=1 Tax=Delitschia confertaspora ATCC 74209 TaxID=1513339 RepID=A0A9P4JVC4_9PLEO|nr:RNA polymerase I associated factor, A49-like protein [Delitschia confertaspora ATCC 74209]
MSEKKRKRHEQREERPAKKVAIAPATNTTVKVKYIEDKDALGPVIASTPGLSFPTDIPLKAYKTDTRILPPGVETLPYQLLLHSSEHRKLDYLAQEEKDGSAETHLKNYIGVYDPATAEMQLMEVRKLTVRTTLRSEIEELREEKEKRAAKSATMTARRHALGMEFGSKKSRKAIIERTENAISRGQNATDSNGAAADPSTDAVASAVLNNMEKTTTAMPTRKELATAIDESKPRPKANLEAESAKDVYPIDVIVGKELMTAISVKDWVDAAENGEALTVGSRFVAKRMNKLAKNGESKDIKKLKVLRFILLGMNLLASLKAHGKGAKSLPKREKLLEVLGAGGAVLDGLRRRFVSESNDLTRWHVDHLITHICAAALIVDDFEVDVNDLRDDLKLENKDIKHYFLEIGCRVTNPTETERTKMKITKAETVNHSIAKLKLPLVFPRAARTGAGKKR